MKAIIVYYSLSGNTRRIAEQIQRTVGGDLAELQTVQPYTGSYDDIVNQGQNEVNRGFMPEVQPLDVDWAQYDVVILGTPVWWYTFAPAMKTFLAQVDLRGKRVYPFATNGGWIGHTFRDFAQSCGGDAQRGLNVRFDEATLRTTEREIDAWAAGIR